MVQKNTVRGIRRGLMGLAALALLAVGCRALSGPTTPAAVPSPALVETGQPAEAPAPPATRPVETPATSPSPAASVAPAVSGGTVDALAPDPAAAMLPQAQADLAGLKQLSQYAIHLTIDDTLESFQGQMHVEITNTEDVALDRLYFRLLPNGGKSYGNGKLDVSAASVNGASVEARQSPDDPSILEIPLAPALEPGVQAQVELDFAGQVPGDFGGGGAPVGYGIYNLTDGVLALSGWYPILAVYDQDGWNLDPVSAEGDSVYSDTAYYAVEICAPADVVVAATGVETGRREQDGQVCGLHQSGPTRDFMLMGSREYQQLSAQAGGTTVNAYYLPGHQAAGQVALNISTKSVEIYNEKFGAYPFKELDVMDAPMRNALGVEFPGIILVASSLFDEPEREDFAVATAHEVGHQWWYSVIGNDVFEEPWLDEALTTFTSALYYEYGRSPADAAGLWAYWQERYDRTKQSGRDDPVTESLAYFESDPAQRSYSTSVYIKGGLFFHALRQEIGDQAFFAGLQQYYRDQKYGIARGQDLLDAFEAAAVRPLDAFYAEWLGMP